MFLTPDTAHIAVPYDPKLARAIPHAKLLDHAGQQFLVVPNKSEEARVARNVGVPIPAPIITRYDWPGKHTPWEVQKITAALMAESKRAYVLNTMGTGKTAAVLWVADYLKRYHGLKRVLISAPLSTLTLVWEGELFRMFPGRTWSVCYGSRDKRLAKLSEDADFHVINHHGLGIITDEIIQRDFDAVVLDELAVFRNKSTDLWKSANEIINGVNPPEFVWGLTGSPTPTVPTDAWAQIRLLTPSRVARTMNQFREATMKQVSAFKYVARRDANEIVFNAMQPSVRFTLDQVTELPETVYVDREVKLEADANEAYTLMHNKLRMKTDQGKSITAVNEGVLQMKLLQVACGYIYTDDKTVYELSSKPRLQALDEVIAETDRKVIVFVPFIHALNGVAAHLRKQNHSVAVVHGGTSRGLRDRLFTSFQNDAFPNILVAHPGCMAHGLTLTSAATIVWYSPTTSLETYEQANARIVRPGQTARTLIAHLSATPVERATYQRLRTKARMQGVLLDMFANQELVY